MDLKASIIILTKNAESTIGAALDNVFSSKLKGQFEVIVIDSGSTDTTKQIIKKYPVRFCEIPAEKFSHGGTRNMGAEFAQGEFLVFLTQDAIPRDENWLATLLDSFDKYEVVGVYGRQIPRQVSPIEEFYLGFLYPGQRILKKNIPKKEHLLKDIFFSNVNSAIKKSIWEKYRFNENLIMSEDQEWSRRVLEDGYAVLYEPSAAVYHSHNYGPLQLLRRNFDSGMSLKGIVYCSFSKALIYELSYLFKEIMYLRSKRQYRWLLRLPLYEVSRLTGFALGFNQRFIPYPIKRRLSLRERYWK